jgi:hypothetical protein
MAASNDIALRIRRAHNQVQHSAPVAADTRIWGGTFVGKNGAVSRPLVAGDRFQGIARRLADNRDGAAADIQVPLIDGMQIHVATIAGAVGAADAQKMVYALDDESLTLSAEGNSLVGVINEAPEEGGFWVDIYTQDQLAAAL